MESTQDLTVTAEAAAEEEPEVWSQSATAACWDDRSSAIECTSAAASKHKGSG